MKALLPSNPLDSPVASDVPFGIAHANGDLDDVVLEAVLSRLGDLLHDIFVLYRGVTFDEHVRWTHVETPRRTSIRFASSRSLSRLK